MKTIIVTNSEASCGGMEVLGYKYIPHYKEYYELDEKGVYIVKKIFSQFVDGCKSLGEIAVTLFLEGITNENGKMLTDSFIRYVLTNYNYVGYAVKGTKLVKRKYKPIISITKFNKAQEKLGLVKLKNLIFMYNGGKRNVTQL